MCALRAVAHGDGTVHCTIDWPGPGVTTAVDVFLGNSTEWVAFLYTPKKICLCLQRHRRVAASILHDICSRPGPGECVRRPGTGVRGDDLVQYRVVDRGVDKGAGGPERASGAEAHRDARLS